jgi:5'-3' exonuclease
MVPYSEADDIITYLSLKNKEEYDCVIISNDRDYLQLIQPGIMVYRWKTKKLYDEKTFEDEFNIRVENYIFRKVLLGDTSDKVEGVTGIGEKTFKRLEPLLRERVYNDIREFTSLLETLDHSEFKTKESNSFKKALLQIDKMDLSYKIMKLDENCLLPEQVEILQNQIAEQENKILSRLSLKIKIKKNPFQKLYNGFNDDKWIQPFIFLKPGVKIKI